ncbi:MAG TPA: glycosyltransferase family 4 protein [Candidatus Elarobacter sp.]
MRGVNLAGYLQAASGVSEIARGSELALARAGIPVARVPLDQDHAESIVAGRIHQPEGMPFGVTLVHANAAEAEPVLSTFPRTVSAGALTVGYWFWELAAFPAGLVNRFAHFDEIWAPSRFCRDAFVRSSGVPVRFVPPHVPERQPAPVERGRFGLERDRFYFLTAFDGQSVADRKNAAGALAAFARMSERTDRRVGLVVKSQRAYLDARYAAQLREAAAGLPVVFFDGTASRAEVDRMIACSDAILSLHRSEGLGLLPIEGLRSGKPVVATGYGGTTDYLDEESGFPVRFELERVGAGHEPYPADAVWANPDIEHAAHQMLRVVNDAAEALRRTAHGRTNVDRLYGLDAAAARFANEVGRLFDVKTLFAV